MPEVYDPFQSRGRRRRKRKLTGEVTASASSAPVPAVRAVSTNVDLPEGGGAITAAASSTSTSHSLPPAPPKTILKKNLKHQHSIVRKQEEDPFAFDETSPLGKQKLCTGAGIMHDHGDNHGQAVSFWNTTPLTKLTTTAVAVTDWKVGRPPLLRQQSSSSTVNRHSQSLVQHALAVDTRFLDTPEGRIDYQLYTQGVHTFLQTCRSRGVLPTALAWKGYDASPSMGGALDGTKTICRCETLSTDTLTNTSHKALMGIPALEVETKANQEEGSRLPEALSVSTSWSFLSEIVQSIIDRQAEMAAEDPLCVTIITSDLSFLLDLGAEAHLHGLDRFMTSVEPHFMNAKIQTIRVAVSLGRSIPRSIGTSTSTDFYKDNDEARMGHSSSTRATQISSLLGTLRRRVEEKSEEVFKQNRSHIQFDHKVISRMDIRLFSIDSKNGFQSLLQMVTKDTLAASPLGWERTLKLALPETTDFASCVVTLQASYKIMPFRLDSPLTTSLYSDLDLLHHAELALVQLIPIESIDASLLYGVPISIRSGLAESSDEHLENLQILQSLFKTLASKDCALFLSARLPETEYSDKHGSSLFHETRNEMLILMPELLASRVGPPTYNGVMFRVASADRILDHSAVDDTQKALSPMENQNGQRNEYQEFVETSLESLSCTPLNPLVYYQRGTEIESPAPSTERKTVTWKVDYNESDSSLEDLPSPVPASNEVTEDAIWNDESGIGLIMTESKKVRQEYPEKIGEIDDYKLPEGSVRKMSEEDASVDSFPLHQQKHHSSPCATRCDEEKDHSASSATRRDEKEENTLQERGGSIVGSQKEESKTDVESGDNSRDESSDSVEDSDDDAISEMDAAEKPKRKPTEILPATGLAENEENDESETEWTREMEEAMDEDESIESDDSNFSSSEASESSEKSTQGKVLTRKFEYS